jgi:UDP-N-acetylmuramyl tripeptide synthase
MTIRALAHELYQRMKRIEELEKEVAALPLDHPRRAALEKALAEAKKERDQLKGALEGAKS